MPPRQVRSKGVAVAMMDQITSGLIGALKSLGGQKTISEDNIDGALRCVWLRCCCVLTGLVNDTELAGTGQSRL